MVQGIYFHIPYCLSKCRYCDFYSLGGSAQVPQAYVDALLRELARLRWQLPGAPDTLYFGGGTPSLLHPAQLAQLIDAAQPRAGAEITLEANPETLTPAVLRGCFRRGRKPPFPGRANGPG
ncbi:MAG: radical SAM protein [Ruthenibacterium sp.]